MLWLSQLRTWISRLPLLAAASLPALGGLLVPLGAHSAPATPAADALDATHPSATSHLPIFITPPGSTDVLMVIMAFVLIGAVLGVGVLFFWLHSLPERIVHNSTKVHFDIVAVLALLSLFTHIHLFWVAALLIALIRFPDFSMPDFPRLLGRIATPLEKIADASASASKPEPFPTGAGSEARRKEAQNA